jgi:hypothetical protein
MLTDRSDPDFSSFDFAQDRPDNRFNLGQSL